MSTLFNAPGHGFSADDPVVFGNCYPDPTTLVEGQTYYVLATDLDADNFRVSETVGGAALALTAELDEFVVQAANSEYIAITDPADVMAPPPAPDAPTALALSSSVAVDADGHQVVRLKAAFTQATTPGLAGTIIEIATTASGPDWTTATVLRAPLGAAFVQTIVPGNVGYSVRAASEDVYGQTSAYTSIETHTATKDASAPATPTSVTMTGGVLSVSVDWAANTEADLSHYEATVSDMPDFSGVNTFTFKLKSNTLPVFPLSADTWYGRVRAVDTSGNASAYADAGSADARLVETGDIDPDATIENATSLINGPATVTIDDNGITIEDGALFLKDLFGETVLAASGFAGTWQEFINLGLYNGLLRAGVEGTIPNGRTAALPYWTLSNVAGSPVAAFQSGGGVRVSFNAVNAEKRFISDHWRVFPGEGQASVQINWEWNFNNLSTAALEIEAYIEYSTTEDFASVSGGTHVTDGALELFGDTGEDSLILVDSGPLHEFARLVIEVRETTAHHANNWLQINAVSVREVPYWHGDVYIGDPGASLAVTRSMDPAVSVDANMTVSGYIAGQPPEVTVFTANGTWNKPAGCQYIVVEVQGAGGAGGSCQSTTGSQSAAAGGGGGGGFTRRLYDADDLASDSTYTVVVGNGGTPGAAGNNDGGAGGLSSFAGTGITTLQGNGGGGGDGGTATTGPERNLGGAGGGSSGGNFNCVGSDGHFGTVVRGDGAQGDPGQIGNGGASYFGGGAKGSAASGNGEAGNQYGGGGAGGWNANSQASGRTGGAGADGIVIVTAFFGP